MTAKELLDSIRANVAAAAQSGAEPPSWNVLDIYLASLEPRAIEPAARPDTVDRHEQAKIDVAKLTYQQKHSWSVESFKAANESGREAMKASILINGGAAVAVLAYVGHLSTLGRGAGSFAGPMMVYVIGVLAGALALGCTYLGQIVAPKGTVWFWSFNGPAILLTICAYATFALGGFLSYLAFRGC
ncbi:MAG: hypothetical protein ABI592_01115 [Acidobacteriota bacterium]